MPDSLPTVDSTSAGWRGTKSIRRQRRRALTATPRLLCVRDSEPSWVRLAQSIQAAGLAPPRGVWVSTCRDAMSRLREEPFDCILIDVPATGSSVRDDNGPFGLIRALRTSGCEESGRARGPAVRRCRMDGGLRGRLRRLYLGARLGFARAGRRRETGAAAGRTGPRKRAAFVRAIIAVCCASGMNRNNSWPTSANSSPSWKPCPIRLRDQSGRAASRRRLLVRSERLRHVRRLASGPADEFSERYRALLRSYVLMGSGSLANEIAEMADHFVAACLLAAGGTAAAPARASRASSKGSATAVRVTSSPRADLLAIELMTHLAHRSQRAAGCPVPPPLAIADLPPLRNVTGLAGIDLSDRDAA